MTRTRFSPSRGIGLIAALATAIAAPSARAADPTWLDRDLLAKLRAGNEHSLTVYSSTNEREGLPLWKRFTDATGIKVTYLRASDFKLMARITEEKRAGQESWDVIQATSLKKMPSQWFLQMALPLAKEIPGRARDKDRRWIGIYANYNTPAYNTRLVKKADLPRTYEDFLKRPQWADKVVIDLHDEEWLYAMYMHFGAKKAETLVKSLARTLRPRLTGNRLSMARSVAAGDYAIALNNHTNLTIDVVLRGGATGWWVLEPVAVSYGQVGVNARSSAPNAAQLAANYLISEEGQRQLTVGGRIPVRNDVETNPPGVMKRFRGKTIIPVLLTARESRAWSKKFKDIMSAR